MRSLPLAWPCGLTYSRARCLGHFSRHMQMCTGGPAYVHMSYVICAYVPVHMSICATREIEISPTFFPLRKKGVATQKNSSGGMNKKYVVRERNEFFRSSNELPRDSVFLSPSTVEMHQNRGISPSLAIPAVRPSSHARSLFKRHACVHTIS